MSVTELSRGNAVRLAQRHFLGRTAVAIQDGCSVEVAYATAYADHMALHNRCPCCNGSSTEADRVAKMISTILENPKG